MTFVLISFIIVNKINKQGNDWNAVEAIEDEYLDAELALIDWFEEAIRESGQDGSQVSETYRLAIVQGREDKIIDMALRLVM